MFTSSQVRKLSINCTKCFFFALLFEFRICHLSDKECIVCGKRFKHTSKLREHSYTHSGVTDAYECNWCGKKFRFGSSWSAHKMKYHPEEMAEAKERLERIKRNAKQKAGEGQIQIWHQV